ncbi:uncharacterized protein MEPE_03626 [Melanopsichium pennsylvanicum]|uniref:Uncharacterized protein n=1 Tax=Melanopsichium pennsylvanicum TaxID=63383 RepID=A0AAJ5C5N1_9BASI|nr:uncharacterized protein MEPE_03626 [Melanopsichium pennsylvanicum]
MKPQCSTDKALVEKDETANATCAQGWNANGMGKMPMLPLYCAVEWSHNPSVKPWRVTSMSKENAGKGSNGQLVSPLLLWFADGSQITVKAKRTQEAELDIIIFFSSTHHDFESLNPSSEEHAIVLHALH